MADIDLPVCAFMVDWKDGVTERLEWRTDILPDLRENEQTRALRLTPRREFDVTLTLWGQERQYWDLWLHRMTDKEFLFPLWHDAFRMSDFGTFRNLLRFNPAAVGVVVGDMLMLRGATSLDFEVCRVTAVNADHVIVDHELRATWPRMSKVWRLQTGRLTESTTVTPVTDQASRTKATFECTREQPFAASVAGMDVYLNRPVFTVEPNRLESIDQAYDWAFGESDSGTGRRYRKGSSGRGTVRQKQTWFLKGRQSKQTFRAFLERQRGAARTLWLPTFNNDMTMSRDAAIGALSIYCKTFGFAYTGGVSSGREHICIKTKNGNLYRRVTGTAAAPAGEERLTITPALPTGLRMADVKRISWMDVARFENDRFEINHVTDVAGMAKCAAIMKTVRAERVPPVLLSYPIPASAMNSNRCGPDQDDACVPLPVDWAHRFTMQAGEFVCNPTWSGNLNVEWPDFRPNGPTGKLMTGFIQSIYGGAYSETQYENFVANDPLLQGQKLLTFEVTDFNNWVLTLYFDPPAGVRFVNIFPAARYCSSYNAPKDPDGFGRLKLTHATKAAQDGVSLGSKVAGGNTDTRWNW